MSKLKKWLLISFFSLLLVGGILFYYSYDAIYQDNIQDNKEEYELFLEEGLSYEDVKNILIDRNVISNSTSFDFVAGLMSYKKANVPGGRYIIKNDLSNRILISKLRSGRQDPVKLTYNNVRLLSELAGEMTHNIQLDSLHLIQALNDPKTQEKYGFNKETFISMFIPNTYQVFWDISAEKLLDRIQKEHKIFWNKKRLQKCKEIGFSPVEVYTLASIVEKESLLKVEKPRIAGVYINRIERDIPLQADPTVVFALKKFDLRRILNKHLKYDNPYNTYIYAGLPPGPIYMPSISGIDAVLNYEKHEFIFFCAKPKGKGSHAFAKTLAGHNRNARTYQRWLNERGIR